MGIRDARKSEYPASRDTFDPDYQIRHRKRLTVANDSDERRIVERWCEQNRAELVVSNNGHHWQIFKPKRKEGDKGWQKQWAEWWPSSAKLVFGKQWKKGIHCHDVQQLVFELNQFLNRKKKQ